VIVDVAAAVILRADGAYLLAQRPPGKVYAGWWEFPGGKIEAGEAPERALARELHEELGIDMVRAYPWLTRSYAYAHAIDQDAVVKTTTPLTGKVWYGAYQNPAVGSHRRHSVIESGKIVSRRGCLSGNSTQCRSRELFNLGNFSSTKTYGPLHDRINR
jgi:mutator protein MutT